MTENHERDRSSPDHENVCSGAVVNDAETGFSRIYEAYHQKVLRYAARLIGRDEADDVAQEVFVKVRLSLETLANPSRVGPWIHTITLNTVRDVARKLSSRVNRSSGTAGSGRRDGDEEDPLSRLPDGKSRTPEETAIRDEMVACFLDYVNQLPPRYQEVYVASEFEELSNDEIAERLSISLGTVKIRLHRARTRLFEALRRNCRCYVNERGEFMGAPKD
jgi:RNA polymerase sigma-70 factor (ECF subfamily)